MYMLQGNSVRNHHVIYGRVESSELIIVEYVCLQGAGYEYGHEYDMT